MYHSWSWFKCIIMKSYKKTCPWFLTTFLVFKIFQILYFSFFWSWHWKPHKTETFFKTCRQFFFKCRFFHDRGMAVLSHHQLKNDQVPLINSQPPHQSSPIKFVFPPIKVLVPSCWYLKWYPNGKPWNLHRFWKN